METKNETVNTLMRIATKIQKSIGLKIMSIGFIILLLMIPKSFLMDLIRERKYLQKEVEIEIASKWGNEQQISGPVIVIPFEIINNDYNSGKEVKHAIFLPNELKNKVALKPHKRERGLYEVLLYKAENQISGKFDVPNFDKLSLNPSKILWSSARVIVGISQLSGIEDQLVLNWEGKKLRMEPGTEYPELFPKGVSIPINLSGMKTSVDFDLNIVVRGSKSYSIVPLGKSTKIEVNSEWPSPSFGGNFLPIKHEISDAGFTANWHIQDLNRNFPQQWIGNAYNPNTTKASIALVKPVNDYSKNERTSKYAMLVIFFL